MRLLLDAFPRGARDPSPRHLPSPKRNRLSVPLWLLLSCAVLCAALAAVALVVEKRRHTIEAAERHNSNVARLVSFHVAHVLGSSSRLLADIADGVGRRGIEYFRSEQGRRELVRGGDAAPELQAVTLVDAEGRLVVASRLPFPPSDIHYADREYFRRHLAGEDLVVGESLLSRSLGRRGATVSRAVRDAGGRLQAVVIVTIESRHFIDLFQRIEPSAHQAISVLRLDGGIFVRLPEVEIGRRIPAAEVLRRAAQDRRGTYSEDSSPIDGLHRMVAYEQVDGFPLVVVSSQARDEVLAPWVGFAATVGTCLVLGLSLLSVLGAKAIRAASRNERLRSELQHQAQTDWLTGLPNRRHFMAHAGIEVSRWSRFGGSLSVLMMDIDHFKGVNDAFGHAAGDRVLKRLAAECQGQLRAIDIIARMGGEEFAVLLPETSRDSAIEVAERLRDAIAAAETEVEPGRFLWFTVSVGIATMPEDGVDIDALLSRADHALYAAKNGGRNRVCTAWGLLPGLSQGQEDTREPCISAGFA